MEEMSRISCVLSLRTLFVNSMGEYTCKLVIAYFGVILSHSLAFDFSPVYLQSIKGL